MRFYLNFLSDNYGKKEIDEPIGIADIDFNIKQKADGMGRDVTLNGGEVQFEFSKRLDHQFEQILYYFNKFGFESKVHLSIEIDDVNKYVCELNFATCETDDFEYFRCKAIQVAEYQIVKRRESVKVDLFSSKNVDGDYIAPINPENVLMLSTPLIQESKWEQSTEFYENLDSKGSDSPPGNENTNFYFVNPCQSLVTQGVENSQSFFQTFIKYQNTDNFPNESDFSIVKAKDNLKGIKVNIKNFDINLQTDTDNGGDGYVSAQLHVFNGTDLPTAQRTDLWSDYLEEGRTLAFKSDFIVNIPELKRDDSIWVFLSLKVRQSSGGTFGDPRFECFTTIKGMSIEVTAESTSYNSICPSVRLIDAMKQVVKSISGLNVYAPRFDVGGQFYDNRLLNGNLLRSLKDKPFNISLEDIKRSLTEMKADYEIDANGNVFFGIEADFYRNVPIGKFTDVQFSEMTKTFNPIYTVNEFYYNYKNYQSLKENTVAGTADTIHGESRFVFNNKLVENKKVIDIQWTRDALLIENQRKQALLIAENTTTQDDDGLFILDCINTIGDQSFKEVTEFSHTYNSSLNKLELRTDGVVNFILLGITVGTNFQILAPDNNAGNYTVFSIEPNLIKLTRTSSGAIGSNNDGIRSTQYIYTIDDAFIPFTNRTNQGFDSIFNLNAGEKYSNLRYSVARNIKNYYSSYLATVNLFWKSTTIKNNWYKNNGECTTTYNGVTVKEKDDLLPSNPILSPFIYTNMTFANVYFVDFVALQDAMRTQRGYITATDNNEKYIRVYPTDMTYSLSDKELTIKAEEKYEPQSMLIATNHAFTTINNETRINGGFWSIRNEKLYMYDQTRQLLYKGVYWYEVSINGAFADTKEKLIEWLKLLPNFVNL
jgi:hypothetical protein